MEKIDKETFTSFTERIFPDMNPSIMAEMLWSISQARSLRISSLSNEIGATAGSYKKIQKFLEGFGPDEALIRFFNPNAPFFIGDITEIPRKEAYKTEWIGILSDSKTRGFQLLTLATPYRGRAMLFGIELFSSQTINEDILSKNPLYERLLCQMKEPPAQRRLDYRNKLCHLRRGTACGGVQRGCNASLWCRALNSSCPISCMNFSIRILVEHAIGGVKRYGIVRGIYRNRREGMDDRVMVVACGLWNFHIKRR